MTCFEMAKHNGGDNQTIVNKLQRSLNEEQEINKLELDYQQTIKSYTDIFCLL